MLEGTTTAMQPQFGQRDPGSCPHGRVVRIGIQRLPLGRLRLYLVTCLDCGTTLTTRTLRDRKEKRAPQ